MSDDPEYEKFVQEFFGLWRPVTEHQKRDSRPVMVVNDNGQMLRNPKGKYTWSSGRFAKSAIVTGALTYFWGDYSDPEKIKAFIGRMYSEGKIKVVPFANKE